MMVRFLAAAREEFDGAVEYYDQQPVGLGQELTDELDAVIERIVSDPTSYEQMEPGIFRLSTQRFPCFPYSVIYVVRSDSVLVVAFQHAKRRPGYWKRRLHQI